MKNGRASSSSGVGTVERPILFSGAMVLAILSGDKTQTRRTLKVPRWSDTTDVAVDDQVEIGGRGEALAICDETGCLSESLCPYGQAKDHLWVRETFAIGPANHGWGHVIYRATFGAAMKPVCEGFTEWKPSIFMPRTLSRITLEVTSVRAERLQDITEEDAKAEGCEPRNAGNDADGPIKTYRTGYVYLWNKINGKKHPWESNPWVWVVEFQPLKHEGTPGGSQSQLARPI